MESMSIMSVWLNAQRTHSAMSPAVSDLDRLLYGERGKNANVVPPSSCDHSMSLFQPPLVDRRNPMESFVMVVFLGLFVRIIERLYQLPCQRRVVKA